MDSTASLSNSYTGVQSAVNKFQHKFANFPAEIKASPHWFPCGKPLDQPDAKTNKAPLNLDGRYRAKWVNDPNSHSAFNVALDATARLNSTHGDTYQYLAYVLSDDDGFSCFDFDPVYKGKLKRDGTPYQPDEYTTQTELDAINALVSNHHTYAEVSRNGQGIHIWLNGDLEPDERARKNRGHHIELYSKSRVIVCTGNSISAINYQISEAGELTLNETRTDETLPVMQGQELIEQLVSYYGLEKENKKPEQKTAPMATAFEPVMNNQTLHTYQNEDANFLKWVFSLKKTGEQTKRIFFGEHFTSDIHGTDFSDSAIRNTLLITLCTFSRGDDFLVERCFMRSVLSQNEKFQIRIQSEPGFLQSEIQNAKNFINQKNGDTAMNQDKNNILSFDAVAFDREQFQKNLHAENKTEKFNVRSFDDLMNEPVPEWLIKNLIPITGFGATFGPSGCGKTFLIFELMWCVSTGRDFFGYKTKAAPVAYVYFEGSFGIPKRLRAYAAEHGNPENINFIQARTADITNANDFQELTNKLRDHIGAGGLVCIDTLAASAPAMDENSSEGMGQMIRQFQTLQDELNSLVMVIHHTGKDETKKLRGHSSLRGALDASIEVQNGLGKKKQWVSDKVKDEDDSNAHSFYLKPVQVGIDSDNDPITSCVVLPCASDVVNVEKQAEKSNNTVATVKAWCVEAINDGVNPSIRYLENLVSQNGDCGFSQSQMKRARDSLIANGQFTYKKLEGRGNLSQLVLGPSYSAD